MQNNWFRYSKNYLYFPMTTVVLIELVVLRFNCLNALAIGIEGNYGETWVLSQKPSELVNTKHTFLACVSAITSSPFHRLTKTV